MAKRGKLQEKIWACLLKEWILAMSWWWNKEQICRDSDLVLSWSKDSPTNNLWINLCGINAKTNTVHPVPFAESLYLLVFHQQSHRSSEMWFVCLVCVSRNLTLVFWFVCRKLNDFRAFEFLFVVSCGNVCVDCDCHGRFLSQLFLCIYYWCYE